MNQPEDLTMSEPATEGATLDIESPEAQARSVSVVPPPAPSQVPATTSESPMALLHTAMQHGYGAETLRDLLAVKKEWEADEARKAYHAAMAKFRASVPVIHKDKTVRFRDKDGNWQEYTHVRLSTLAAIVSEIMAGYGLAFHWRTERLEGGLIRVWCVVTHELGHEESTSLEAGLDNSGKKNNIQQMGSTVRYLQRYTLECMTGIAAADDAADNDGADAGTHPDDAPPPRREEPQITEGNLKFLRNKMTAARMDEHRVVEEYGPLEQIDEPTYREIIRRLDQRAERIKAAQQAKAQGASS